MLVKSCNSCKKVKPISEFYKRSGGQKGVGPDCKDCIKIKNKIRYQENPRLHIDRVLNSFSKKPEQYKVYQRQYVDNATIIQKKRFFCTFKIKPIILKRDSYCCQLCNKLTKLTMHHITPINKNSTDASIFNPKNLIILCKQCHLKAHDGAYKRLDMTLAKTLTEKVFAKERLCETVLPEFQELI